MTLQDLDTGIDRFLADVDTRLAAADDLPGLLTSVRRAKSRIEGAYLRVVSAFDQSKAWQDSGATSTADWLHNEIHVSPSEAHKSVRTATDLADGCDTTADALSAGDISAEHASVITKALDGIPDHAIDALEEELVAKAALLDPVELSKEATRAKHRIAPQSVVEQQEALRRRRSVTLTVDADGAGRLHGLLHPEATAAFRTALDAYDTHQWVKDDPRSPAQRRHDALEQMATDAMTAPPAGIAARPAINVVVSLETLEGRLGSAAAEIDWTGPISGETARRLACDATIHRFITAPGSVVLDAGRGKRTVSDKMKKALGILYGGRCGWLTVEGQRCDRPTSWCDAHHIVHWIDGGDTSVEQTIPVCGAHHLKVHEGGWTIHRRADGRPVFHPPGHAPP